MIDNNKTEVVEIWYNTEFRFEHPECFIQKLKYNNNKIPHIGDTITVVNKDGTKTVKVVDIRVGANTIIFVEDVV